MGLAQEAQWMFLRGPGTLFRVRFRSPCWLGRSEYRSWIGPLGVTSIAADIGEVLVDLVEGRLVVEVRALIEELVAGGAAPDARLEVLVGINTHAASAGREARGCQCRQHDREIHVCSLML